MDGTLISNCNIVDVPSEVKVYKGEQISTNNRKSTPNVIVFDLDETLGSYADLVVLWGHLKESISFNDLLDLYPEFSRYGILSILDYIYKQKIRGHCDKIFIYTNNNCSYEFVELISNYFSYKLGIDDNCLFDQIIRAFKVDNKRIEILRTTKRKTHTDFIRCTLLPQKTKICFIDNSYFPDMENHRIYYVQPMSYHHHLSKEDIIERLPLYCDSLSTIYDDLYAFPESVISKYGKYFNMKKKTDVLVARKMMYYIRDFFYLTTTKRRTKKRRHLSKRVTRKII